jgi:Tfp pilus assembly protein PilZ
MLSVEMRTDHRQSKDSLAIFREYMTLERRRESGLSPADLRRWLELRNRLESVFGNLEPPGGRQRRATPRVPTCLEVGFENLRQLGSVLISNMSRGGIFVAMDEPPPIGTELKLRIRVASPAREIVLCGEVASLHVGPGFEVGKRGMGIRFKNLSADEQAMVDELYEKQVARHLATSD